MQQLILTSSFPGSATPDGRLVLAATLLELDQIDRALHHADLLFQQDGLDPHDRMRLAHACCCSSVGQPNHSNQRFALTAKLRTILTLAEGSRQLSFVTSPGRANR